MQPDVDDRSVGILRRAVPELEPRYQRLLADYGEHLMPFLVFNELADLVGTLLLEATETTEAVAERCCEAVEAVAVSDEPDRLELVGYGFIDGLNPYALARSWDWMGPKTRAIMTALEAGDLDPDSQLEEDDDE